MQHYKFLKCFLLVVFICLASEASFARSESFKEYSGISLDSIPKSEVAEYRKSFESVEKTISSKRGNYEDAKRQLAGLSGSRVRSLPEFAGRFSVMQQKLSAWNLELNPKQPPVVVPNNPTTPPKNTGRTNENAKPLTSSEVENKSLMLTYFPDTLTVGNEFLAYVEITKDNSVKFGNLNTTNNSTLDSIIISSVASSTGISLTQVTVELSRDGGADNFTINSRSDKTRTIGAGTGRWEWNLRPTAAGETRLRLNVTYQKQSADGKTQEVTAINKFIVVKGLSQKTSEPASTGNLLWIILGVVIVLGIVIYVISRGSSKKNERRDDRIIKP